MHVAASVHVNPQCTGVKPAVHLKQLLVNVQFEIVNHTPCSWFAAQTQHMQLQQAWSSLKLSEHELALPPFRKQHMQLQRQ